MEYGPAKSCMVRPNRITLTCCARDLTDICAVQERLQKLCGRNESIPSTISTSDTLRRFCRTVTIRSVVNESPGPQQGGREQPCNYFPPKISKTLRFEEIIKNNASILYDFFRPLLTLFMISSDLILQ